MNDTIFVVQVLEELAMYSEKRNIGWFESYDDAHKGLQNFGDERRWDYALIEELCSGVHGYAVSTHWFKYNNDEYEWETYETPCKNQSCFMACVNHTIG